MIGTVDEKGRAFLDVPISDRLDGAYTPVTTWIDTAFDGHLVFPRELIERLNFKLGCLPELAAGIARSINDNEGESSSAR